MHHDVRIGQLGVDLLDHIHGEHVARRLPRELVGAMRRADSHGKRVDLGLGDEAHRFVGISQQHRAIELALEAVAVFRLAMSGL